MQRALTQQREAVAQRRLHQDILALSPDDRVRQAYLGADRFSTQLITCVPTPARRSSNAEFREMFCTYVWACRRRACRAMWVTSYHVVTGRWCAMGMAASLTVLSSQAVAGTTSTTTWRRSCFRVC